MAKKKEMDIGMCKAGLDEAVIAKLPIEQIKELSKGRLSLFTRKMNSDSP